MRKVTIVLLLFCLITGNLFAQKAKPKDTASGKTIKTDSTVFKGIKTIANDPAPNQDTLFVVYIRDTIVPIIPDTDTKTGIDIDNKTKDIIINYKQSVKAVNQLKAKYMAGVDSLKSDSIYLAKIHEAIEDEKGKVDSLQALNGNISELMGNIEEPIRKLYDDSISKSNIKSAHDFTSVIRIYKDNFMGFFTRHLEKDKKAKAKYDSLTTVSKKLDENIDARYGKIYDYYDDTAREVKIIEGFKRQSDTNFIHYNTSVNTSKSLLKQLSNKAIKIDNVSFKRHDNGQIYELTIFARKLTESDYGEFQIRFNPRHNNLIVLNDFNDLDSLNHVKIPLPPEQFQTSVLILMDVLSFDPYLKGKSTYSIPGKNYPNKVTSILAKRPDDLFSITLGTDLLGLLDNSSPNGKIQIDFNGFFEIGNRHKRISFFQDFSPSLGVTKIGLSNAFIKLTENSKTGKLEPKDTTIGTTGILQYSNLNFGARINIMRVIFGENSNTLYINWRLRVFKTPFTSGDSSFSSNFSVNEFEAICYMNYLNKKVVFVPSLSIMGVRFLDPDILQLHADNVTIQSFNNAHVMKVLSTLFSSLVYSPQFMVFYSPTGDKTNRVFFKAAYTYRPNDFSEGYMQLQVGYTQGLSNFLKSVFSNNTPIKKPIPQ